MLSVAIFERFELAYWFLDVPQMRTHLNTPANHQAKNACVYTVHITSLCQVKCVPLFLFAGVFERHFSTNTEPRPSKLAEFLHHSLGLLCDIGYFTEIVSCHFISNSMLLPGSLMRSLTQVILTFFTAYLHKGELVRDHRAIACHYLRTWFLPDSVPRHAQ